MRSLYVAHLAAVWLLESCVQAALDQHISPAACAAESQSALIQRQALKTGTAKRQQPPQPLQCEFLSEENCSAGLYERASEKMCYWHPTLKRCQAKLAWFHVMKCGSTFGATLAHFANSSLPENAHIPSCGYVDDTWEDECPEVAGATFNIQGPSAFFMFKYPTSEWFRDVFWRGSKGDLCPDPGQHHHISSESFEEWKGSFVGMFRQPEQRVVSSFNHFCEGEGEIQPYSEFIQGTVTKLLAGLRGRAPVDCEFSYEKRFARGNCSMLSGQDHITCSRCLPDSGPDLPIALERLNGFGFVGIMEEYDLSVCLFHAMYGGECLPTEFVNMRKGVEHKDPDTLLEQLVGHEDPYDGAIYAAVNKTFWDNVKAFGVSRENCAQICPEVEAFAANA